MMAALGPVEASARDPSPGRLEGGRIHADVLQPAMAGGADVEKLVLGVGEMPAPLERSGDGDAEMAGKMIIAAAGEAQLASLRRARLLDRPQRRGERRKRLEGARHRRA